VEAVGVAVRRVTSSADLGQYFQSRWPTAFEMHLEASRLLMSILFETSIPLAHCTSWHSADGYAGCNKAAENSDRKRPRHLFLAARSAVNQNRGTPALRAVKNSFADSSR